MFGVILLLTGLQAAAWDNYIELEIKLESEDYIQLFTVAKSDSTGFSEDKSHWKLIKPDGYYQIVRWDLPDDLEYRKFRIDVSTKKEHQIAIRSLKLHVNGLDFFLEGDSILTLFAPNRYLELLECTAEKLKFRSINVDNFMDPSIIFLGNQVAIDTLVNANLKVNMVSDQEDIMSVEIRDRGGVIRGQGFCLSPGKNEISFSCYLDARPQELILKPSINSHNLMEFNEVVLSYENEQIRWLQQDIFDEFDWTLYEIIEIKKEDFKIKPLFLGYMGLRISKEGIVFWEEKALAALKKFAALIFLTVILFQLNKYWAKRLVVIK